MAKTFLPSEREKLAPNYRFALTRCRVRAARPFRRVRLSTEIPTHQERRLSPLVNNRLHTVNTHAIIPTAYYDSALSVRPIRFHGGPENRNRSTVVRPNYAGSFQLCTSFRTAKTIRFAVGLSNARKQSTIPRQDEPFDTAVCRLHGFTHGFALSKRTVLRNRLVYPNTLQTRAFKPFHCTSPLRRLFDRMIED